MWQKDSLEMKNYSFDIFFAQFSFLILLFFQSNGRKRGVTSKSLMSYLEATENFCYEVTENINDVNLHFHIFTV